VTCASSRNEGGRNAAQCNDLTKFPPIECVPIVPWGDDTSPCLFQEGNLVQRMHFPMMSLVFSGVIFCSTWSSAAAGFGRFCGANDDCNAKQTCQCECTSRCQSGCRCKCCRPKRHCCLCPPDAPDGEIGFAQAAVIRPGPAVRIDQSALNRAVKATLADDVRKTESASNDKTTEERLAALEDKVNGIDSDLTRLTNAIDKLIENSKPAAGPR